MIGSGAAGLVAIGERREGQKIHVNHCKVEKYLEIPFEILDTGDPTTKPP